MEQYSVWLFLGLGLGCMYVGCNASSFINGGDHPLLRVIVGSIAIDAVFYSTVTSGEFSRGASIALACCMLICACIGIGAGLAFNASLRHSTIWLGSGEASSSRATGESALC